MQISCKIHVSLYEESLRRRIISAIIKMFEGAVKIFTSENMAPEFLQFLALLQQLLARHVSLPEIETFVMTQERIVVQVLKRRWHHHLARGLRAV